jgi:hypothetical protein
VELPQMRSYFKVNIEVAAQAKQRMETRLGVGTAWLLNPGGHEFLGPDEKQLLPHGSSPEYMFMWTKVLEGEDGQGAFDFVYFLGPSNFARFFGFDGKADMEKVNSH